MGEPSSGAPPLAGTAPEDRLDSWKEIAAYLKRDVTTVQRWEKREGMPVRRHLHDKLGSVYALRSELDAWTRSRNLPLTANEDLETKPPREPSDRSAAVVQDAGPTLESTTTSSMSRSTPRAVSRSTFVW
jgi:hypothetical protein